MVFFSIPDCFVYFFLGIKKTGYSYITALILNVALGVFSAILIPIWLVDGAALAYFYAYFSVFAMIVIFFSIKNRSNPLKAETYIDVPKGFEIEEKYIFEASPTNIDELMKASEDVIKFAEKFEKRKNRCKALSLAIEELGATIIKYGLKGKSHYIFEMRIVYD